MVEMIAEMEVMKRNVLMSVLRLNLSVRILEDVSRVLGSVMVTMIVLMDLMKLRMSVITGKVIGSFTFLFISTCIGWICPRNDFP